MRQNKNSNPELPSESTEPTYEKGTDKQERILWLWAEERRKRGCTERAVSLVRMQTHFKVPKPKNKNKKISLGFKLSPHISFPELPGSVCTGLVLCIIEICDF